MHDGHDFATCDAGLFDGFRVDTAGNVWTSAGDGVHVFAPDGTLLGKILIPEAVANVEFGGPKRNRLFICATTSLYALYVNARGCAPPRPDAAPPHSSSHGEVRAAFTAPRRAFASSRRRTDPAVGRVGRRGFGRSSAARISARSFSRASSRFSAWLRCRSAVTISAPSPVQRHPASRRSRAFTSGARLGDRSASKRSATAVETLLTFCPPGPEARWKVSVISQSC